MTTPDQDERRAHKESFLKLIELLSVSWDKPLEKATLASRSRGYFPYIGDLPHSALEIVIKDMAVGGRQWIPRPGELRVATIAMMQGSEPPASAEEAWSDLQARRTALSDGRQVASKAAPVLSRVMGLLGKEKAITLHTNGDRDMFSRIYEVEREKFLIDQYGLKHDTTTA